MSKLLATTRELIVSRPRNITYQDIAEKCEVTVPFVASIVRKRYDDPGVCKVERIFTFLSGRELKV